MNEGLVNPKGGVVSVAFPARTPQDTSARKSESTFDLLAELSSCTEIELEFEPQEKILWCFMKPRGRPCFTPTLLEDSRRIQQAIERQFVFHHPDDGAPLHYLVLASRIPGVFNMGGDLRLIGALVEAKDRDGLMRYARACIDVCYANAVHGDFPFITISLVQGDALGGGFEAALSGNVLIAERSAQFGLPEVLFNLFPGMGAYNFLTRRVGGAAAEKLILNGTTLKATELYDLGIIDALAEDGRGIEAVYEYVDRNANQRNAHAGIYATRQKVNPLDWNEMVEIGRIWVEAALALTERDLRKIKRLAGAQERRMQALGLF